MEPVYVLRDYAKPVSKPLGQVCQRAVTSVGLRGAHRMQPLQVPAKHSGRIFPERTLRGQFFRIESRPQAGLRFTKCGDSRLGRHARPGQHHHAAGLLQQVSGSFVRCGHPISNPMRKLLSQTHCPEMTPATGPRHHDWNHQPPRGWGDTLFSPFPHRPSVAFHTLLRFSPSEMTLPNRGVDNNELSTPQLPHLWKRFVVP